MREKLISLKVLSLVTINNDMPILKVYTLYIDRYHTRSVHYLNHINKRRETISTEEKN